LGEENVKVELATDDAQKYYDMLKKAEKPLHERTKHNELNATVGMYNLKLLVELVTIFSWLSSSSSISCCLRVRTVCQLIRTRRKSISQT